MQAKRVDDWGYCSDYCEFYLGVSVFYLNVTMIKLMGLAHRRFVMEMCHRKLKWSSRMTQSAMGMSRVT